MAVTINGSGTITGISTGGLPDGVVDADTLATNSVDSAELIDGAVDNAHLATGVDAAKLTTGTLPMARLSGTLPALNGSALTALGAANITSGTLPMARLSGTLPALNGSALTNLPSSGKLVQYGTAENSSAVTTTSQTMVDIPGVSVTLSNVTIGNVLKITGWITVRRGSSGSALHTQFGAKVDNVMLRNSTYGLGANMVANTIHWIKAPILTFHTATATSHTVKLCGGINGGETLAMGGEVSNGTAYDYAKCFLIVEELD